MTHRVIRGDVLRFAAHYQGEPFHAILCDPPYHLNSIVKRFGPNGSKPAKGDVYARSSRGFMNAKWDGGDISFRPETWAALANLLHPGAFGMAFAGSRGWHRMAVAIEDAGLIIHPSVFGWCFSQGFPKASRIDTQVDRANGHMRSDKLDGGHMGYARGHGDMSSEKEFGNSVAHVIGEGNKTAGTPIDALAATWAGHRYGLQALKPALEPIIVFQRPYEGRPVESITRTGAGALNVDGGRLASHAQKWERPRGGIWSESDGLHGQIESEMNLAGRWPANFLTDETTAPLLDAQSGELNGPWGKESARQNNTSWFSGPTDSFGKLYRDGGGASRFYFQADWNLERAEPVMYCAKASREERDAGLGGFDPMPNDFQRASSGLARPNVKDGKWHERARTQTSQPARNGHPTVKPIALARWLATLLLPPAAYAPRRILVPFAGVGSEMIGAFAAGWECIVGVEGEREYAAIARARLDYWTQRGFQLPFDGVTL